MAFVCWWCLTNLPSKWWFSAYFWGFSIKFHPFRIKMSFWYDVYQMIQCFFVIEVASLYILVSKINGVRIFLQMCLPNLHDLLEYILCVNTNTNFQVHTFIILAILPKKRLRQFLEVSWMLCCTSIHLPLPKMIYILLNNVWIYCEKYLYSLKRCWHMDPGQIYKKCILTRPAFKGELYELEI